MMINVLNKKRTTLNIQLVQARRPLRILLVTEAVALAHMARATVLAQWAREAGCEVLLAAGPHYQNVARERNIEPVLLDTIEPQLFAKRLARGQFFYNAKELDSYLCQERALLRSFQPDVVVSEFRLTMALSAQLEGRPLLTLANAYWSPATSAELPPPTGGPLSLLPYPLRASIFKRLQPLALKAFSAPLNRLRHRHDLPKLSDFREHYTAGQACGYCDVPEMLPLSSIPENHFYLGPIPWQPYDPPPLALAELGLERPLIYLTLGSTGDAQRTRELIPCLLHSGYDLVVSGLDPQAKRELKAKASSQAGRLLLAKCVDPQAVLRKAVLTICHGGSGTIYQSLAQGVPLLCLPHNPDQGMASTAVEIQGCGRTLSGGQGNILDILDQVTGLLTDPAIHAQATRMRNILQAHNTKAIFLAKLNEMVSGRPMLNTQLEASLLT